MISGTTAVSACISPSTIKLGSALAHQSHGARYFLCQRMPRAAEIGERQQRHPWLLSETSCHLCGADGNLRQVFGGRLDVDRGVRQEIDVALAA